jgi:thiamine-phosphate pyrophosphorylase
MHYNLNTKYYFINNFDTNNIDKQNQQTIIIYRNYTSKKIDKFKFLEFKNYCKKKGLKLYLSNNIKLALELKLDGAYIPSFNKKFNHLNYKYDKNFKIIGSAHNLKEIKIKELQKVEAIFISSLFKKNKNFLGINRFKNLSGLTKKRIIALGGINKENIKLLNLLNKSGFAGISYFE